MAILGTVRGLCLPWSGRGFGLVGASSRLMEQFDRTAFDRHLKSKPIIGAKVSHRTWLGDSSDCLRVWTDDRGLWCEIKIPNTHSGREAKRDIESGRLKGFSIGFGELDYRWVPSGRPDSSKVKLVTQAELREISVCESPAYLDTTTHFRWTPETISTPTVNVPAARIAPARRQPDIFETTRVMPPGCGDRTTRAESEHRRLGVLWHKARMNLCPEYAATHSL